MGVAQSDLNAYTRDAVQLASQLQQAIQAVTAWTGSGPNLPPMDAYILGLYMSDLFEYATSLVQSPVSSRSGLTQLASTIYVRYHALDRAYQILYTDCAPRTVLDVIGRADQLLGDMCRIVQLNTTASPAQLHRAVAQHAATKASVRVTATPPHTVATKAVAKVMGK